MPWSVTASVWGNAGEHIDYALLLDGFEGRA